MIGFMHHATLFIHAMLRKMYNNKFPNPNININFIVYVLSVFSNSYQRGNRAQMK